jgi:hypothetical protein
MKSTDEWRRDLRRIIAADNSNSVFLQVIVSFILPIVEGVLTSIVASAICSNTSPRESSLLLLLIGVVHLVLGIILVRRSSLLAPQLVAESVEISEALEKAKTELSRRYESYRMVRASFDALNTQTCQLEAWCDHTFQDCLSPILAHILENTSTVLGVNGSRYTIEIYIQPERILCPCRDAEGKSETDKWLVYFSSPTIRRDRVVVTSLSRLVNPIFSQNVPKAQTIDDDRALFFDTGATRKGDVYFYRYAAHPVYEVCGPNPQGVIILTSEQREAFADDILDTLGFMSSLLARFIYSFNECASKRMIAAGPAATVETSASPSGSPEAGASLPGM